MMDLGDDGELGDRNVQGLEIPFRTWRQSQETGKILVQFEQSETNVTVLAHAFARDASG